MMEILFVIAVIAVLVMLLLPAIQAAREAARRSECLWNLQQLVLGTHQYHQVYQAFPPGTINDQTPIVSRAQGYHHSWIVRLLPYLEETALARQVDFRASVYAPANAPLRQALPALLQCPSDSAAAVVGVAPWSSYAGCHHHVEAPIGRDNQGAFIQDQALRMKDFPDGLAHTIFFGEKRSPADDLGWFSGTRATLRNTGSPLELDVKTVPAGAPPLTVGGFGSWHGMVVNMALGDGHVFSATLETDRHVLQSLAHRRDGTLVEESVYRP